MYTYVYERVWVRESEEQEAIRAEREKRKTYEYMSIYDGACVVTKIN